MFFPKDGSSIAETRLIGRWNENVPVFDVQSMHGLNQIVGYVKHNNAENGTVLYRGQTNLYEKLIPSILHGYPSRVELSERNNNLEQYILSILSDKRMSKELHFDELQQRYFYKQVVIESMLQHYGVRTHCQDFVDNHWTALWFGLYELKKESMAKQGIGKNCFQYYYSKRDNKLKGEEICPRSLQLDEPKLSEYPPFPKLVNTENFGLKDIKAKESLQQIQKIADPIRCGVATAHLIKHEIQKANKENDLKTNEWNNNKKYIKQHNEEVSNNYRHDLKSDTAYVYLLLYVADTQGVGFRGVYSGTETLTVDLRKALPSTFLRPSAQHGWTVRNNGIRSDLSDGVVCVLRLTVELVNAMLGQGELVSQNNFFPLSTRDDGYRILLCREGKAPFGNETIKWKRDLPSIFPYGTIQHYIVR